MNDQEGNVANNEEFLGNNVAPIPTSNKDISNEKKLVSKKKSELWAFFTPLSRDYALCSLCDIRFSYKTSTSNLKKHLIKKHSIIPLKTSLKFTKVNDSMIRGNENNERIPPEKNSFKSLQTESVKRRRSFYLEEMSDGDCDFDNNFNSQHLNPGEIRDEFDAYGVTIAAKLRKMEEKQRLYCEKIINEALFKGAFDELSSTSELVVYVTTGVV